MSNDKSDSDFENFKTILGLYIDDPWERVKFIFKKNDFGEYHPELMEALNSAELGLLGGVVYGGYLQQKKLLLEIKERSDAKIYHNRQDAYRQMSRESFMGFFHGAYKWGPRVAAFTGGFKLFASCVEAYRSKPGIIEYSIGGATIGGLLKWNFGIRGMMVGSLVGVILGTTYGVIYYSMCNLTRKNSIELKYGQYAFSKYMNEKAATEIMKKKKQELGMSSETSPETLNPLDGWKNEEKQ